MPFDQGAVAMAAGMRKARTGRMTFMMTVVVVVENRLKVRRLKKTHKE